MGLLLVIMVVVVTIGIEAVLGTNGWIGTFVHDIRGFSVIAGVLLALEVWGLIPHPTEDINED